jgi:hypothetical protein
MADAEDGTLTRAVNSGIWAACGVDFSLRGEVILPARDYSSMAAPHPDPRRLYFDVTTAVVKVARRAEQCLSDRACPGGQALIERDDALRQDTETRPLKAT